MNHTPTPWEIKGNKIIGADIVQTHGWKENRCGVSNRSYSDVVCEINGQMDLDAPQANAQHIVRCVKAHDVLVEALHELIHEIEICQECGSLTDKHYIVNEALPHARKALTLAEKEG